MSQSNVDPSTVCAGLHATQRGEVIALPPLPEQRHAVEKEREFCFACIGVFAFEQIGFQSIT
jgi:hypothetical protein